MSAIEQAILGAIGAKPQRSGENRQKYLIRVMTAVQKLPDDQWEELAATEGAQAWCNAAIEADNEKKDIPDFPDAEAAAEEEEPDTNDDEDSDDAEEDSDGDAEEEAVTTKAKTAKTAKTTKAKAAKTKPKQAVKASGKKAANGLDQPAKAAKPAAKPAAAGLARAKGVKQVIKQLVIKNPRLTVDEILERIAKKNLPTPSRLTVSTFRADTRGTIKVMNELGLTSIDI